MGETSTNIATLNMDDALKVRVKDGCDVEDPCASSPCPQHSRCFDAWDSYTCVCDKGGAAAPRPFLVTVGGGDACSVQNTSRNAKRGAGFPTSSHGSVEPVAWVREEWALSC